MISKYKKILIKITKCFTFVVVFLFIFFISISFCNENIFDPELFIELMNETDEEKYERYSMLANRGDADSQYELARMYHGGIGVKRDWEKAEKWYKESAKNGNIEAMYYTAKVLLTYCFLNWKPPFLPSKQDKKYVVDENDVIEGSNLLFKAAEKGHLDAINNVAYFYYYGICNFHQDYSKSLGYYTIVAESGSWDAQYRLGTMYESGLGTPKNYSMAAKWYHRASIQGYWIAQLSLADLYATGLGVRKNHVKAYFWYNIVAARGVLEAINKRDQLEQYMTANQIAEAQRLSKDFKPINEKNIAWNESENYKNENNDYSIQSTGTAFFINNSGNLITNHHVIDKCEIVKIEIEQDKKSVEVVAVSTNDDIAVLKLSDVIIPGFAVLKLQSTEDLGEDVIVAGYPLRGLLADNLNISTGIISALAGPGNDRRFLQITAPVQPGNSGGPLLDVYGHVIGVIIGKLDAIAVAEATGDIPQNVNFAIKAAVLRSFLDINGIEYQTGRVRARSPSRADLVNNAKSFTVPVECWK